MATAMNFHPVLRSRRPQTQLRIVGPVLIEKYEGKPYQRTGPPRNNEPRPTMPKLRDGGHTVGGSRDQILEEVLDFLGEGEQHFEDAIRRVLR